MNPLLQGLFKEFCTAEGLEKVSKEPAAFELFATTLILPNDLLTQAEKTDFLLDPGTVGVDIVAFELNGRLVWDVSDVVDICEATKRIDASIHFVQAKQSNSISSAEILNVGDTVRRFLENEPFPQFPKLNNLSDAFRYLFDNYASSLKSRPMVFISFATTASRASTKDGIVLQRATSIEKQLDNLGFVEKTQVHILGADELHNLWNRKFHSKEVEIQLEKHVNLPKMPGVNQAILGVISVSELLKLVESSAHSLDERVFYDNVRGFKGEDNPVNRQIMETLRSSERALLPVLNNGVTVVAASYAPKPGDAVAVSDYQVVNGCQTSHCLHLSRDLLGIHASSIYVPIRLVVTDDEEVATRIIRATNSQTEVQENDLVALTKFQKTLEDYYNFDAHNLGLKYERRSGQFYSKNVTKTRIVTINDQMRAAAAVLLDNPHTAARFPTRLYAEIGGSIFREGQTPVAYLACAYAAYRIENAFRTGLDPNFKPARYHILMAYKYQTLGGTLAPLHLKKSEEQSRRMITELKRRNHVDLFRSAADLVVKAGGGQMPTPDRLKRQQFTQELLEELHQLPRSKSRRGRSR